jgi:hypothetical protein
MTEPPFDSLDVYEEEWKTIDQRAHRQAQHADRPPLRSPQGLVGLALSGGGIRSATFNLGVLQALQRARLLTTVDYLSTVSGGGYIGGWWSAWLTRTVRNGSDSFPPREAIETWRHDVHAATGRCRCCHREQASPTHHPFCSDPCRERGAQPSSPDPVHHVRLFSNYLTPRKGALSRDLWRAVTVISRNLVLTWVVMLSILAIPILLAQSIFAWVYTTRSGLPFFSIAPHAFAELKPRIIAVADIPLAFVWWFAVLSVAWLMLQRGAARLQWFVALAGLVAAVALFVTAMPPTGTRPAAYVSGAIVVVFGARIWTTKGTGRDLKVNRISRLQSVTLVAALVAAAIAAVAALGHEIVNYVFFADHQGLEKLTVNAGKYLTLGMTSAATFSAARAGMPAGGAEAAVKTSNRVSRRLLSLAPPLILLMLVLTISWAGSQAVVKIDDLTEWTTVLRNITLVGVVAMAGLAVTEERRLSHAIPGMLLALGPLTILIAENGTAGAPFYYYAGLAASFAALLCIAARAARGLHQVSRSEWLIGTGSVVAIAATVIALGALNPPADAHLLLNICGALSTMVILLGWTTDPNTLSLHTFYKMRLVRAYLGASNPERTGFDTEDITETKQGDDVLLSEISNPGTDAPYHLVNATLNLTAGSDLVIAQRAAAPFLFSKHFCGSARTGYRRTATYRSGTLSLGTAVAISGAAASPVMGSQTPTTSLSMLMALLNVRLGYWVPTPNREDWRAPQARFWPFYLLREFFSHTADTGRYCYVTDGGHFDNTGAYALIERGCRVIVLTDCGADPDCVFDDLANLVRRCRIDFGATITFPSLVPFSRETLANDRRAFVVGRVDYRTTHLRALGWTEQDISEQPQGTLVVVKPTLLGKLETDVTRYSQTNKAFPQQSTGDQWFDEAQFESYRRLGEISGESAAEEITTHVLAATPRPGEVRTDRESRV